MEKAVANKKKRKKKKEPSGFYKAVHNETVRFVIGVVCALLAVFTLVSMVSYLFTWAQDQSLLTDDNIYSNSVTAENTGGKLGFLFSHLLVSRWFGLGAFIIPFFFAGLSLYCFKVRNIRLLRLFFLSLTGCIVLSALFSYIFSFTSARTMFGDGAGGSYGYYVNEWLVSMTGAFGAACVILFFLALWVILLNNKIVNKIISLFNRLFAKKADSGAGDTESVEDESREYDDDGGYDEEEDVDGEEEEDADDGSALEEVPGDDADKEPELEIIAPEAPVSVQDTAAVDQEESAQDEIPPVEVIGGDPSDYSSGLSDEQWRTRYDPRLSLSNYRMPDLSLLKDYSDQVHDVSREELERNNRLIVGTLKDFKISISKISARVGPTVTLYEVVPAPGVRVAQIVRLEDDIARSLAARGVRVVMLTGTNAIGIEVANDKPSIVSMRSILSDPKFNAAKYDLPVVIGRTISNEAYSFDLAKMPHLLVAGATGQGKSVGLNAIITSLLYKKHPAELKFVLVDPKKVELSLYSPLEKHYLAKMPDSEDAIITDTKQVVYTLRSLCKLMDHRYDLLKAASVRNIKEYNEKFLSRKLNPYKGHEFMPYIVVIIDEFADLLMTAGREVEEPIARLAQLARAIGIHLVIATQRPTTNIITGTIKANFPARIAFRVISSVDSKTILDQTGANQLIGRGDMLISTGNSEPVRLQCAFIDTPEVENIASFISSQAGLGGPYLLPECEMEDTSGLSSGKVTGGARDELFKEAARLIVREQVGSTSLIQRKMNLGYNRAGRIMDQLEDAGIVGPSEGSKPRQVRITSLESLDELLSTL
ncbi:MAG TPA: DNA translocase FtsK [Candidatus Coprenecus stercoravium]|uniref:DNA translocase FtsK n=1 Tax=Candidatus Coprenecus stercoravium TaxID=2840735 RepID=A0A9D2KA55_9BACT|nr:DNA translocase FtsK [Candidatus Coprenecus stercoravium]